MNHIGWAVVWWATGAMALYFFHNQPHWLFLVGAVVAGLLCTAHLAMAIQKHIAKAIQKHIEKRRRSLN